MWTKKELISATNAVDPSTNFLKDVNGISGISIDDRTVEVGDLFIALIGKKFDGHNFVENALKKGAYGIIVSNMRLAIKYNALLVEDTKDALIKIAEFARKRFQGITIALTGSSGKTSTKHLLSTSLQKFGRTHYTLGNNNNIIGLSLTLSRLHNQFDYCILELGMNNTGEIRELTKIAQPDIAMIINVSSSHIQNFKDEKSIAAAKSEIFSGLKKNGIAIINSDNSWSKFLVKRAERLGKRVHLFGHSKHSDTKILKINENEEGSVIFYDNKKNWYLKYLNTTHAMNAIATISVIKELKLSINTAQKTISRLEPLSGRGKKLIINFKQKPKTYLIDESYNANPDSMKAALSYFYQLKQKFVNYEAVLIIGDMLELGKYTKRMHIELIPIIKKINPNLLITIGDYSKTISDELNFAINCQSYSKVGPLLKKVDKLINFNQLILIKGSNGIGLWKLVPVIKNINQEKFNAA